jgi:riboflavin biosynthesis pyrimidine reductase
MRSQKDGLDSRFHLFSPQQYQSPTQYSEKIIFSNSHSFFCLVSVRKGDSSVKKPKVVVCGKVSVDGRLTLAPGVLLLFGDKRWDAVVGKDTSVDKWLKATHKPQVFLEGSGSFVAGDQKAEPLPTAAGNEKKLYRDFLPDSVVHRKGHSGWFAVVDSKGLVRWAYKEWPSEEWKGWHLLVLVAESSPCEYLAYLRRENIPYLVAGKERVDLRLGLEKMKTKLNVKSVISTSPGKLGGALLRSGLVDEIDIEFFPAVIGGFDTPSLFDSPALEAGEWPTRLKLVSSHVQADGCVWLRYKVLARKHK